MVPDLASDGCFETNLLCTACQAGMGGWVPGHGDLLGEPQMSLAQYTTLPYITGVPIMPQRTVDQEHPRGGQEQTLHFRCTAQLSYLAGRSEDPKPN